jgi:flagellar biosynthesis protein FliR
VTDLTALLTEISLQAQVILPDFFLVFLRIGVAMAVLPAFGESSLPLRVKLAAGFAFSIIVLPAVSELLVGLEGRFLWAMLTETGIGLLLGMGLRLMVFALQIAGTIAAQATSLSQLFASSGGEPQSAISTLLVLAGLALAVNHGLHVHVAALFIQSYSLFPLGFLLSGASVADLGVAQVGRCFALAFSLSAPFTAMSLIYNIALGVINRAMPQLMVVFVGAPALTLGGLVLLALMAPLLLTVWVEALSAHFADPLRGSR